MAVENIHGGRRCESYFLQKLDLCCLCWRQKVTSLHGQNNCQVVKSLFLELQQSIMYEAYMLASKGYFTPRAKQLSGRPSGVTFSRITIDHVMGPLLARNRSEYRD
jgi:hypothetical protein